MIDMKHCLNCGCRFKVIAAILDAAVIAVPRVPGAASARVAPSAGEGRF